LPPASPAASPKRISSGKPQQEENDWDFDDQETSLELHTLENIAEQETFGSDSQELLQETIEQTQLIQEEVSCSHS
jgi:hypothetical protein